MTSKLLRSFLAIAVFSMISAFAQTSSAAAPAGGATSPATSAPSTPIATGTGTKLGTINIEQAVMGSNEGQRDFEALRKKLEPKQNELKAENDELESLQKQLQTQGDKLNDEARATLVKQIETKKKAFDRSVQDAQEDAQNQQKEIFQRILQKMAPVIVKHAQDGGYAMVMDTSNPWPQSPIALVRRAGRYHQRGCRPLQREVRCTSSGKSRCGGPASGSEAHDSQAGGSQVNYATRQVVFPRHHKCRESSLRPRPARPFLFPQYPAAGQASGVLSNNNIPLRRTPWPEEMVLKETSLKDTCSWAQSNLPGPSVPAVAARS